MPLLSVVACVPQRASWPKASPWKRPGPRGPVPVGQGAGERRECRPGHLPTCRTRALVSSGSSPREHMRWHWYGFVVQPRPFRRTSLTASCRGRSSRTFAASPAETLVLCSARVAAGLAASVSASTRRQEIDWTARLFRRGREIGSTAAVVSLHARAPATRPSYVRASLSMTC